MTCLFSCDNAHQYAQSRFTQQTMKLESEINGSTMINMQVVDVNLNISAKHCHVFEHFWTMSPWTFAQLHPCGSCLPRSSLQVFPCQLPWLHYKPWPASSSFAKIPRLEIQNGCRRTEKVRCDCDPRRNWHAKTQDPEHAAQLSKMPPNVNTEAVQNTNVLSSNLLIRLSSTVLHVGFNKHRLGTACWLLFLLCLVCKQIATRNDGIHILLKTLSRIQPRPKRIRNAKDRVKVVKK